MPCIALFTILWYDNSLTYSRTSIRSLRRDLFDQFSDVPGLDVTSINDMDEDTLCHRLLFGDPSLGTIENRVILEATISFIKILANLIDTKISNQQQQFPINYVFMFVLFSVFLVMFYDAKVDYLDKPCFAIFSSPFTATS